MNEKWDGRTVSIMTELSHPQSSAAADPQIRQINTNTNNQGIQSGFTNIFQLDSNTGKYSHVTMSAHQIRKHIKDVPVFFVSYINI